INKDTECFYKRRDFQVRPLTQMERITGSREQKIDYYAFINAYLQDFYNLRNNYLEKSLLGVIIYILLRDRFISDNLIIRKIACFIKFFLNIKK
ncbi:hypothetical protein, partial [Microcystis sp. M074S1]|uniref:hypothetical protein n=1 Tax=Microcystis sp. M074S1 TaxID=2771126 RepID=UPI00258F4819